MPEAMMKHVLTALLLAVSTSVVNGADVKTEARVSPQMLTVGLSPSISVDVTNISVRPVAAPVAAALLLSPVDGGEPFFARIGQGVVLVADPSWNDDVRDLAPRQMVTLEFPATSSLIEPAWFIDPRLAKPGAWRLQVALVPPGTLDAAFDELGSPSAFAGELSAKGYLSSPVTLTFTEPQGDDARACEVVAERVRQEGCPIRMLANHPDLARRILAEFPRSSYAPYLLLTEPVGNATAARIALYEKAISLTASSNLSEWYRWLLAEVHEFASADYNAPAETTRMHDRAARGIWEQLAKSKQGALRRAAAKKLHDARE